MGAEIQILVVLQVAGEEDVTVCHNQCSTSELMIQGVIFFGKINLQVSNLKCSVLK